MSLPLEILDIILVRVRFKPLAQICCLSGAWHHRWESVPFLDIKFSTGAGGSSGSCVLWLCASPIRAFRADGVGKCDIYCAARWLRSLSGRSNLNLTLSLLGLTLFSWSALIRLHLECCHMLHTTHCFSGFFPTLLSLVLDHVALPFMGGRAQLECLIATTPRLAVLNLSFVYTLSEGDNIDTCAIWPPNRRKLSFAMMGAMDNGLPIFGVVPTARDA
uniref:F-box domain-containing protein n=1 Tax=Leersia perrieri TaxID=77586 RepID=A0A0D9X5U4_9ORYZ